MSHELWLRQAYEVLAARGNHMLANTCRQASVSFAILRRELAEAKAENERLKTLADERSKLFYQVVAERDQLKSCEVDARRYRWLRMRDWFDGPLCVLRDPKTVLTHGANLGADCPSRDRLDTAIDAALAQSQPQPLPGAHHE